MGLMPIGGEFRRMSSKEAQQFMKDISGSAKKEEELKNCPFCNSKVQIKQTAVSKEKNVFLIKCNKCGTSTPVFYTKEELTEFWNKRNGK